MSDTKIEWATKVWNPVTGCTKISPGCKNCYAERMSKRLRGGFGYPAGDPFKVTLHHVRLDEPWFWNKPQRVFVCSMGDLFHEDVPFEFITKVFETIAGRKKSTFLILTKRPERLLDYYKTILSKLNDTDGALPFPFNYNRGFSFPNLWLGVSVEDQEQANKRIPILLQIPAAVRFVSVEPMLGPVDLKHLFVQFRCCECGYEQIGEVAGFMCPSCGLEGLGNNHFSPAIDWCIVGGESGHGASPMHPDWARKLRDQCVAAGVPFMFKQWGAYKEVYRFNSFLHWVNKASTHVDSNCVCLGSKGTHCKTGKDFTAHQFPVSVMRKVGKKAAGRELDGRVWDEYPT